MIATTTAEAYLYLFAFLLVIVPLAIFALGRVRFRAGRRVEFTAPDGRVGSGMVDKPPAYLGRTVRVRSDHGELLDVKKAKPLKQGAMQSGAVSEQAAPPDWYPDPLGEADLRYWDGSQWTDHTSATTKPPPG